VAKYFDEAAWAEAIAQVDWYVRLDADYRRLQQQIESADAATARAIKTEIREFFEHKLEAGDVALAGRGGNLDIQRAAIDIVVIHHTSAQPGYTLPRMNAVHLLNLYRPHYLAMAEKHRVKPAPAVWSGHFDEAGRQVFYGYHWLVHMDGSATRLLSDRAIGWHAGDWDINTRSVGICLDNDYMNGRAPSAEVLTAVKRLIRTHYPQLAPERIIGHREANPHTVCPGDSFIDGWQRELQLDAR